MLVYGICLVKAFRPTYLKRGFNRLAQTTTTSEISTGMSNMIS